MPGRQRFKITASGSQAATQALLARINAALGRLSVHSIDAPPEESDGVAVAEVRLSRSQDRGVAREEMRGLFASLQNLSAILTEHECFHELEEEPEVVENPDLAKCNLGLKVTRFVDGEEQRRGEVRNGRQ